MDFEVLYGPKEGTPALKKAVLMVDEFQKQIIFSFDSYSLVSSTVITT